MTRLTIPIFIVAMTVLGACNRAGEIKVRNSFSRMTIENVYWGDVYIGGALKSGEETEYSKVKNADETLPNSNQIVFTVVGKDTKHYYTSESFELDKGQELFIELSDTMTYYEVDF